MKVVNLHNVKHSDVEHVLADILNNGIPPFKIITGNSKTMRDLVIILLEKYELAYHNENFTNYGCLVVTEKEWSHHAREPEYQKTSNI